MRIVRTRSISLILAAVLAASGLATGINAQSGSISLDELVEQAEEEGSLAPMLEEMPARIGIPFLKGDSFVHAERKCVDGRNVGLGPARSGEFVIGGNLFVRDYRAGSDLKIWWAPLHYRSEMTLVVKGRMVGMRSDTMWFESSTVAWAGNPGTRTPEPEREYFFPSGISFPKAGIWVVTASQGPDWGCFILEQRSSKSE